MTTKIKSMADAIEALQSLTGEREVVLGLKREYNEASKRYNLAQEAYNKRVEAVKEALAVHFPELIHRCEDC